MVEQISAEGIKKLKEELHELKTVKTKEIADMLKYAASFGDLKENAGYDEAKERQSWLIRRIMELEGIVHSARVYEKKDTDGIQIGSTVLISLGGEEERFEIVSSSQSDILKNKISYESPLGRQLMGQKIGDAFDFTMGDKKTKVKVLEVK